MTIVRYTPRPLVYDANLRAGWTGPPIGGLITDVSGNGKVGTPVLPGSAWEEDSYFGSVLTNAALESGWTFPCSLGVTTTGTWMVWYKLPVITLPAGGISMFMQGGAAAEYFGVENSGISYLKIAATLGGVARTLLDNLASRVGVWTLATATYDGDKLRLYADDALRQTSPSYGGAVTNWNAGTGRVAYYQAATFGLNGSLRAPQILNRCLSDAEIAAYYSLAKQAAFCTGWGAIVDLADEGGVTGGYLSNTQWQFGDAVGRFRVETDQIDGRTVKCVTCKTAGNLYLDANVMQQPGGACAFGDWTWWHYRASAIANDFGLFTDRIGGTGTAGMNGWFFDHPAAAAWQMIRLVAGVQVISNWGTSGMSQSTWIKMRVSRSVAGVWSLYANDALLSTAGGAGTNPFTDATLLTGNYITLSMGVGDKISLGDISGDHCVRKGLK